MRPVTLGCGQGPCGCSCGQGFGAAHQRQRRYPKIEGALRAYINEQLANSRQFYVSPTLNSSVIAAPSSSSFGAIPVTDPGGSFLSDAITNTATSIGNFFSNVWSGAGDLLTNPAYGSPDWQDDPSGMSSPVVSSLPSALQGPVSQAAQADILGVPTGDWIIGGAAALFLVILLTMPHNRGRRR